MKIIYKNKRIFALLAVAGFFGIFFFSGRGALAIDSDSDGYDDELELASGYSPFNPAPLKLSASDVDSDGLSDEAEIHFGSDPFQADSDSDGYGDREEVDSGYSPASSSPLKLEKRVVINLKEQKLKYFVGGYLWKDFPVSSGKPSMPTPKGEFKIINKVPKAWSAAYGLYMPYWLGLGSGRFGIHELPVWPSGYREGEDHLGQAVSHGCIRLGIGPAQYLYERVEVGQTVEIE